MVVLLTYDAPCDRQGNPKMEQRQHRIAFLARIFTNTESCLEHILRDLHVGNVRPLVYNIIAPLNALRPAQRPQCRPLCPTKEKVRGNTLLCSLLQSIGDVATHTCRVSLFLGAKNIHYHIWKLLYGVIRLTTIFVISNGAIPCYIVFGTHVNFVQRNFSALFGPWRVFLGGGRPKPKTQ